MWALEPIPISLVVAALVFSVRLATRSKPSTPLPPGPPGLPIVGNVLDMPTKDDWLVYASWARQWGDFLSVRLLGQPIVILNSARVMEMMEKSSAYSTRPTLQMGGEIVGYSKTIVLMPYGQKFRDFRKYFSRIMGTTSAVQKLSGLVEQHSLRFLQRTLAKPSELTNNLRKSQGAVIMNLAYGIDVQEENDPYVTLIEKANDNFSVAATPGRFMVDVFPFLRYVPAWVPGAGFQTIAKEYRQAFNDMVELPFAFARQLIASDAAPYSFLSSTLQAEEKLSAQDIDNIKHTAASMYGAGADTVVSSQHAFFLAMILHPDVQKTAQAEIDDIVGTDRLPTLADRENLPYVNALVSEMLRWHQVAPLGVPHCAMEDGIVDGYMVPKGTIIIANLWAMLHDPEVYPNPFQFDPTRFIKREGHEVQRDPRHATFGFGRRICPGMHLAEASLYMVIAHSLAVFDISPAIINGVVDVPVHANTMGTISHPKTFNYNIKPRSPQSLSLVTASLE